MLICTTCDIIQCHTSFSCFFCMCFYSLTRAQKLLIASEGNPRLLRAVRVKSRGSSQSLKNTIQGDQHITIISSSQLNDPQKKLYVCVLPNNSCFHQFNDLPLGNNSVSEIESAIFPLHRAVQIQSITQPEIWGSSWEREKHAFSIYSNVILVKILLNFHRETDYSR